MKHIKAILSSGQDQSENEPDKPSDHSSQYGFTRGAEYYDRGEEVMLTEETFSSLSIPGRIGFFL